MALAMRSRRHREVEDPDNPWSRQLLHAVLRFDVAEVERLFGLGADLSLASEKVKFYPYGPVPPFVALLLQGKFTEEALATAQWLVDRGCTADALLKLPDGDRGNVLHALVQLNDEGHLGAVATLLGHDPIATDFTATYAATAAAAAGGQSSEVIDGSAEATGKNTMGKRKTEYRRTKTGGSADAEQWPREREPVAAAVAAPAPPLAEKKAAHATTLPSTSPAPPEIVPLLPTRRLLRSSSATAPLVNFNAPTEEVRQTPVEIALATHRPNLARLLLQNGAVHTFDRLANGRNTMLARACIHGDTQMIRTLLTAGDNPAQISSDGFYSLMHFAAGQPSALDVLSREFGLSIDTPNAFGETALISLVRYGAGRNSERSIRDAPGANDAARLAQMPIAAVNNYILTPSPAAQVATPAATKRSTTVAGSQPPAATATSTPSTGGVGNGAVAAPGHVGAAASQPSSGGAVDLSLARGVAPATAASGKGRIASPLSLKAAASDDGDGGANDLATFGGGLTPAADGAQLEQDATTVGRRFFRDSTEFDFWYFTDCTTWEMFQTLIDRGADIHGCGTAMALASAGGIGLGGGSMLCSSRNLWGAFIPASPAPVGALVSGIVPSLVSGGSRVTESSAVGYRPTRTPLDMTPLMHAIHAYHPELVRRLVVDCKVDLGVRDAYGATALHYAATARHPSVLELLLSAACGPDRVSATELNAQDDRGWTPLHCAVAKGNADTTRLLLSTPGILPGITDFRRRTPLHLAVIADHIEVVTLLAHRCNGESAFQQYAATLPPMASSVVLSATLKASGSTSAAVATTAVDMKRGGGTGSFVGGRPKARSIVGSVSNTNAVYVNPQHQQLAVDAEDDAGATALQLAACQTKNVAVARLLLDVAYANVNIPYKPPSMVLPAASARGAAAPSCLAEPDQAGLSLLHRVVCDENVEMVELLLASGARVDTRDAEDCTPMYFAVASRNVTVARLCIKHGADINDRNGKSLAAPAHVACRNGDVAMVQLLLRPPARRSDSFEEYSDLRVSRYRGRYDAGGEDDDEDHYGAAARGGGRPGKGARSRHRHWSSQRSALRRDLCDSYLAADVASVDLDRYAGAGKRSSGPTGHRRRWRRSPSDSDDSTMIPMSESDSRSSCSEGEDDTVSDYHYRSDSDGATSTSSDDISSMTPYTWRAANFCALDADMRTPLHHLCSHSNPSVQQGLISAIQGVLALHVGRSGMQLLRADRFGRTALHESCLAGFTAATSLLLGKLCGIFGACRHSVDGSGATSDQAGRHWTPLSPERVEALGFLSRRDGRGWTAFHDAVAAGDGVAMELLLTTSLQLMQMKMPPRPPPVPVPAVELAPRAAGHPGDDAGDGLEAAEPRSMFLSPPRGGWLLDAPAGLAATVQAPLCGSHRARHAARVRMGPTDADDTIGTFASMASAATAEAREWVLRLLGACDDAGRTPLLLAGELGKPTSAKVVCRALRVLRQVPSQR